MADRKFSRVDVTNILNFVEGTKKAVTAAKQDLQIEAAKAGAEKMKEFINERGTGKDPWGYERESDGVFIRTPMRAKESPRIGSLRSGSTGGRVNTGNMRDSVDFRFESGPERTISSFGWINSKVGRGEDGEYFLAQEYGFQAGGFRAPQNVVGMFALRDARLYVSQQLLPRLAKKYAKRIARGNY
jgi:hypothetical protein